MVNGFLVVLLAAAPVQGAGVLTVNGVEVSAAELAVARQWARLESPAAAHDDGTATTMAVDNLVADILLAEAATRAGEKLDKNEGRAGIDAFRTRLGGEGAYNEMLRTCGADEDVVLRLVERHRLAWRFVERHIAPTVRVSEAEARAWYDKPGNQIHHFEQINVRLIFVNAPPGASAGAEAAARKRIEGAERRILAGEEFGAVARDVSEDMSRSNDGTIGWIGRGVLPRQLEDAVWRLEPGETSSVLRGDYGFGLVQVVDHRPAGSVPFDEARGSALSNLTSEKTAQAKDAAVAELRAKAKIVVHDPSLTGVSKS
jgi:peptidyl-prolyl cis-trans isomerase C